MRFFENGPSIPLDLLSARDRGGVIFLCGAGISKPAGLPDFKELTEKLITKLGVPKDSKSRKFFEKIVAEENFYFDLPLDRVLAELKHEYGTIQVESKTAELLEIADNTDTTYHEVILRLSTNAAKEPKIITTNFDLLFEKARPNLTRHTAPVLPDLSNNHPWNGIIYLHGRIDPLQAQDGHAHGLILGSADFGRAYLANGWATRFMRELLCRNTVVLLGYSADDPPIRYLLEGLQSDPDTRSSKIYTFAEGTEEEVREKWRNKGVFAIPYGKSDGHSALWQTLSSWAEKADNPNAWQDKVIDLARMGPRDLKPHERGQVTNLISTADGAKRFSEVVPPLPAEWICVFDTAVRYSEPSRITYEPDEKEFDPLDHYKIDDDSPRGIHDNRVKNALGIDFLSSFADEKVMRAPIRLGNIDEGQPISPRLFYIGKWIAACAHEIDIVWWYSGALPVHSRLKFFLSATVTKEQIQSMHPVIKKAWQLLLDAEPGHEHGFRRDWHDFIRRVKEDGWSNGCLREFAAVIQPYLTSRRPKIGELLEAKKDIEKLHLSSIAKFDVAFPEFSDHELQISNEILLKIIPVVRHALMLASNLFGDIWPVSSDFRTPTLHKEDKPGDRSLEKEDRFFLWFAHLHERLANIDHISAAHEWDIWPSDEPLYFNKLKTWAAGTKTIGINQAFSHLSSMNTKCFWNRYHDRELLWTLKARWNEFSEEQKKYIEAKIIQGRDRYVHEETNAYAASRSAYSAIRLGWLKKQGCKLSSEAEAALLRLRSADPGYKEIWEINVDESFECRGGWVRPDLSPDKILNVPISEIIEKATLLTSDHNIELVSYQPFDGLVSVKPSRAIAALKFETRNGHFSLRFWQSAFNQLDKTSARSKWLFANLLIKLPNQHILELNHFIPGFFTKQLPEFYQAKKNIWPLYDHILEVFVQSSPAVLQSRVSKICRNGEKEDSRRTLDYAINSPIGELVECILKILDLKKISPNSAIPIEIKSRLEKLLTSSGDGKHHAICIIARYINWLYSLDPEWIAERITPYFACNSGFAEAAWSGFTFDDTGINQDLFRIIKPSFLESFQSSKDWANKISERLGYLLVRATIFDKEPEPYLTYQEARQALQKADSAARQAAISQLSRFISSDNDWTTKIKPFIEQAWPRELCFQTKSTSSLLADIASKARDQFPEAVRIISPLLLNVDYPDSLLLHINDAEGKKSLGEKYPEDSISLIDKLVSDDPQFLPYDMNAFLEKTAEAKPALYQNHKWQRLKRLVNRE